MKKGDIAYAQGIILGCSLKSKKERKRQRQHVNIAASALRNQETISSATLIVEIGQSV
jgi:hypothetical protein